MQRFCNRAGNCCAAGEQVREKLLNDVSGNFCQICARSHVLRGVLDWVLRPWSAGETMRKLFAAVLLSGSVLSLAAANAAGGCGPGCHSTIQGECVVDGWGILPPGARNECPAGARAIPSCPRGFAWKHKACFPN